jgi:CheY-like chemotaxis protein
VLDMLKSAMPASIRLHYQFDDKLPPVLMSPVNLHQVMMNLVVNARDAVSKVGAIQINAAAVNVAGSRICTSCHREFSGDFVQISVADNGLGITQENLNRIFDPFFTTKAVGQGTGLGLAVLHGIVHSALGHVIVDSIEGRGTQFNVYLPTDTDQIVAPPVQVDGLPDMTRIRGNVMVIDDESSIVGFVTILLQNLGCHVIGLTRPVEALGLFRENPDGVDMVITDQSMPEMTGADLAAEMLKIRPDLPVVLCTGYSNLIDEEEIKDLGVQRLLSKPIPARVLVELVTEFLGPK